MQSGKSISVAKILRLGGVLRKREVEAPACWSKVRFAITQTVLTFVASALPTALMGALMYRLLTRFTTRPWPRIGVVLGYGLLTPAFAAQVLRGTQ